MSRFLLSFVISAVVGLHYRFTLICRLQISVRMRCCAWSASDPSICSESINGYIEFQGGLKFLLIVIHPLRGLGLCKRRGKGLLILLGDDHRKCNRTYNLFGIIKPQKSLPFSYLPSANPNKRETLGFYGFYNNFIY